ncbi:MAG: hypothetical protein V7L09_33580 [Nostoc sp.]|uniref:hypothetical protein n=1 Tax=Nostoc sp. TaxID=1180 RepID=UPI002FF36D62
MTRKNDKTNGKAKRATAGRGETLDPAISGRQGGTHEKSEGAGVQGSERDDSRSGEWRNTGECGNKPINATYGEVLEHLGNLEARFYNYVHAHQERLDLRRKESNTSEQEFAAEAEELRTKILGLIGGFDPKELDETISEVDTEEPE